MRYRAFWYTTTNISGEPPTSGVTTHNMKNPVSSETLATSTELHNYPVLSTVGFFETLRTIYQTTWRYIQQLWSLKYSQWSLCCCSSNSRKAWVRIAIYPPSYAGCSLNAYIILGISSQHGSIIESKDLNMTTAIYVSLIEFRRRKHNIERLNLPSLACSRLFIAFVFFKYFATYFTTPFYTPRKNSGFNCCYV